MNADNSEKSWETATKWEQTLNDIIWSSDDEDPRFRHEKWEELFDDQLKSSPLTIQSADPLFSLPIGKHTEQWTVWLPSKEAVWERFHTISHIANLENDRLQVGSAPRTRIETDAARKLSSRFLMRWMDQTWRRMKKVILPYTGGLSLPTHLLSLETR